ncbi:nuclear transport factor 2 family protein [Microbulbifer sp. ARAS458-1]|uniref:nuclear transport factor 2 family protein n=1 Tax=Microbulbifer sp. ARAS458-1 TaxID=3140242 RepID=UPI0038780B21
MDHSPRDILDQWMQAVNGADVERLLNLYDPHAVLIPTFSNRILNTPEKLRDYFEKLGSRPELSIALHEKTLTVQEMKSDQYTLGAFTTGASRLTANCSTSRRDSAM